MHREKFYQLQTETTTAVETAGKTDPSEIDRTYNIRKQFSCPLSLSLNLSLNPKLNIPKLSR